MGSIALYMRLSSEDSHAGESLSIGNQRDLLYDFIRSRREFDGRRVMEFSDDGYSGTNFDRPGVKKLLALAGNVVDCIVVKDFSRFGRNLVDVGDYLDQVFPFLGVRFIAVNEGYDSADNPGSTIGLDVSLKAMVYEMYSRDISEKIRCVQQAKMRKGEYLCAIAFYGYQKSKEEKNKLVIDECAANVVRRIFTLAAEGKTLSEIADRLNQDGILSPLMYRKANHTDGMRGWKTAGDVSYWTLENVKRIISDERYTGCLIFRKRTKADISTKRTVAVPKDEWIVAKDCHEAIISKECFDQAQNILRHVEQKKQTGKPQQKFRGIVKCRYCGRVLKRMECKTPYFYCPSRKSRTDSGCAGIRMGERDLERTILESLRMQAKKECPLPDEGQQEESRQDGGDIGEAIHKCQLKISRYKSMQAAAFEDYAEERINKQEYLMRKKGLAIQQEEAERECAGLSERVAAEAGAEQKKKYSTAEGLKKYAKAEGLTREMLEEFVQVVKVSGKDKMEIVWKTGIKDR